MGYTSNGDAGMGICLIYLLTVSVVTTLAITTTSQYILISILEQVLSAIPQHLHQRLRKPSVYGQTSYRGRSPSVQCLLQCYASLISSPSVPRTGGLSHMATHGKLHHHLGKRRLQHRKRGLLIDEKYHHHYRPGCFSGISTEQRATQNLEFSSERRIPFHQLSSRLYYGMSEHGDSANSHVTPVTICPIVGIMPRPSQPGALCFDGMGVTDFLKEWNIECEEYGLTDVQKCKKLPRYCNKEIGDTIEKLKGYIDGDWELFQRELKHLFWRTDPPKDTTTVLFKLIDEARAGKMNVDMYVLQYTSITNVLVKKGVMSTFDRNVRLLDGLSEDVQTKVFEYGSKQGWRMLEYDIMIEEPEFEEVKGVVLEKAKMMERQKLFMRGGFMRSSEYAGSDISETPTASTMVSTIPTTITSPASIASGSLKELSKKISRLTLFLEA